MLLAVDVGNSNTVLGVASDDAIWSASWRISTPRTTLGDDWAAILLPLAARDGISLDSVRRAAIASVVPTATIGITDFIARTIGLTPLIVRSDLDLGVMLEMDHPSETGADRIANAVAAWTMEQTAAIIVDLGTATKVEAIDGSGTFHGGAIAPGLGVTLDALTARAARLYEIELQAPKSAIGRNTVQAMQAGIVRGHVHLVRGLVADIRTELATPARLILTGGYAAALLPSLGETAIHVPNLTLDGIRLIHLRNVSLP
jgi:type III pantothenate kinase